MDCREINGLFTAYLDGELTAAEHKQVEEHLKACPLCRDELEALSLAQNRLRQTLEVAAQTAERPPQVWESIKREIEADNYSSAAITAKIKIKGVFMGMKNILTSRQPVWRTGLTVMLATALLVSLSILLPSLMGQEKEAMAAEDEVMHILRADPQTAALLDDGAIVNFLESDNRIEAFGLGDNDTTKQVIFDDEEKTVSYYRNELLILANRVMVEIALGDKVYMADVDVLNNEILSFGERGDPNLRSINPRFAVECSGETIDENGEKGEFYSWTYSCRSWDEVQYYMDPLFEDNLSYYSYEPGEYEPGEWLPNMTIPD